MTTWTRPNDPRGPITSPFGPRGPIAGAPDASRYHLGVDLRAGTRGVPASVFAAADGSVRRIYRTPLGAWVLELDHGVLDRQRVWTRYVHMQRTGIHVAVGARVAGGQHVADASNTGAPTVHLHFEVLLNGTQTDPVPWLRARGIDLTTTTPEDDMFNDDDRGALTLLFKKVNQAGAAGQLASQGDINIVLAQLAALNATVAQLAKGQGADPDAIAAAAEDGARRALAGYQLTLTKEA